MDNLVLLSGCSGGGKSTLLAELGARGHHIVTEPGRRIVDAELAGDGSALPWTDPAAFARRALAMAREDRARAALLKGWVFFDRGTVDAACALAAATGRPASEILEPGDRYHRRVFMAPPWPEIYARDTARQHGMDLALDEYERLSRLLPQLGYDVIELPRSSVAQRADFIEARLG